MPLMATIPKSGSITEMKQTPLGPMHGAGHAKTASSNLTAIKEIAGSTMPTSRYFVSFAGTKPSRFVSELQERARNGTVAAQRVLRLASSSGSRSRPFVPDVAYDRFWPDGMSALTCDVALLRKSTDDRNSPFPGHTYLMATVVGMPRAVKRFRTATRIWASATWRSKSRAISRCPSSFMQFNYVTTLLRRWYTPHFRQSARPRCFDGLNQVRVPGHAGPHAKEHHDAVFNRLQNATRGLDGQAYTDASKRELSYIRYEVADPGSLLSRLVVKD